MPSKAIGKAQLRNAAMVALVSAFSLSCCSSADAGDRFFALQPLGKVDDKLLALMRRFVEAAYVAPCKVMAPLELPGAAYNAARKQYRASELLSFLKKRSPRGAIKVAGITEKDIYTRQMNFIFGLADLGGKSCVLSAARLHQSFWGKPENDLLLYRRALKIIYHELGHTFGMKHCDKIQCAMCYHNSLPELDVSYVWFCPTCTQKLKKLAGPFPKDRDAKMAELLTEIGLVKDVKLHTQTKGAKP